MMRSSVGMFTLLLAFAASSLPAVARDDAQAEEPGVIAVFSLRGPLSESYAPDEMLFAPPGDSAGRLISRMRRAADDAAVRAVVLLVDQPGLGPGQVDELHRAMDKLQEAGKPVYAHAQSLSMTQYVLLSRASSIRVVPTGDVWITGLYSESPHVQGLLERLGVEADFMACGAYKSAAEMFTRSAPSESAAENLDWLLDGMFANYVALIAEGRDVSAETARAWIDQALFTAETACVAGLIDGAQFLHELESELKERYGERVRFQKTYGSQPATEVDLSNPFVLLRLFSDLSAGPRRSRATRPVIAVVQVDGPIMAGEATPGGFPLTAGGIAYSGPIRRALEEAARDEAVRAVVLRVNSPGGSAVGSEVILEATRQVKEHKPIVVSMGDVAGSGGYYVACGVDTIFANPSTTTGSIGVVGGKLATSRMWDRVGVNFVPFQRGERAGMLASGKPFTDAERAQLQEWMGDVYSTFKGHVVQARGERLNGEIDELAGGRVYTGQQAYELGLVDQLGGLDEAIRFVADEADVDDYEIRVLPRPRSLLEVLLGDANRQQPDERHLSWEAPRPGLRHPSVLEAALPHLELLDAGRLQAVVDALRQLEIARQETVMLTMPVIRLVDHP